MTPDEFQQASLSNGDHMLLNEYQRGAIATAIYPGKLAYPTLGLCGEIGELVEILDTPIVDMRVASLTARQDSLMKEVGDVLWYVANVANDASLDLNVVANRGFFPVDGEEWHVDELIPDLAKAAGVVAENVKKTIRDHDGVLTPDRRQRISEQLSRILTLLARVCGIYGVTLEECAILNNSKLRSRQERGVLKGDGDDR